jgi:hypothetical protein
MIKLKPAGDKAKCHGQSHDGKLQCGYRESCGRYMRPMAHYQTYSEFYKYQDDDCAYFEPMAKGE